MMDKHVNVVQRPAARVRRRVVLPRTAAPRSERRRSRRTCAGAGPRSAGRRVTTVFSAVDVPDPDYALGTGGTLAVAPLVADAPAPFGGVAPVAKSSLSSLRETRTVEPAGIWPLR